MDDPVALRRFDVIVLAAGSSRRFGEGNKLTQPYRGRPLLGHVMDLVDRLDFGQRIIVTGAPYRDDVHALLAGHPLWRECINPRAVHGMGSSIAAGATLVAQSSGVFICPGDMPDMRADDFLRTAALFKDVTDICRPIFGDQPGHPVLFGRAHYRHLVALEGDMGASSVIRNAAAQLRTYAAPHAGVVTDFDALHHFAGRVKDPDMGA